MEIPFITICLWTETLLFYVLVVSKVNIKYHWSYSCKRLEKNITGNKVVEVFIDGSFYIPETGFKSSSDVVSLTLTLLNKSVSEGL